MKKTSKITIGIIIIGILLLGIGYAAIQNITLYIKGTVTADPTQENFKVRFTGIPRVSNESKVTAGILDDLNATIKVEGLEKKGETLTATYDIENVSTGISANLTIETTNSDEEYFEIKSELAKTSLVAGEKTTVTVTVKLIKEPIDESEEAKVDVEIIAEPVQPGEEGSTDESNILEKTEKLAKLVKENPTDYYGKYVDYPIDIDLEANTSDNDWKIFYSDGKNVFLIADDYVPNSKVPADSLKMDKIGNYGIYWNSFSSKYSINNNSYMFTKATDFNNSNYNYKIVANLLATNEWENFVDETLADTAIGSPTVEMWIASWNNIFEDKLYCDNKDENGNNNEYGYYIGTSSYPSETILKISSFEGYNNSLYFPHKEPIEFIEEHYWAPDGEYSARGYYLACPSALDEYCLVMINSIGQIEYNMHYYSAALRPVVCLNENVKATLNGDVLKLSK